MDAPPVQYVTTSDGLRIAYGVRGRGTPLILLPGIFYHVQLAWEYPGLQAWLHGLSERFQLIQLDPRGTGMSSRDVNDELARDHYVRDIETVVGQLRLDRFMFLAVSFGVDLAVEYTLQHPEHVIALVLGTSGASRSSALFETLPVEDWDAFLYGIVPRDRSRDEVHRIVELTRQASDQRNYLLRRRVLGVNSVIEERLSRLRTETLVLHARDYAFTPVEEGMKKAQLSGGRMVIIDGSDPFGDAEQGIRAIETFLADLPQPRTSNAQRPSELSSREIEVLRLLAAGRSNQQIANALVISPSTVLHHVTNILTKTGCSNRTEAAAYAHRHRLA
jgi:DNA-binding CsgD family transcriptional regulator/pimeloyl-ACP methyl ester carboxylesterase